MTEGQKIVAATLGVMLELASFRDIGTALDCTRVLASTHGLHPEDIPGFIEILAENDPAAFTGFSELL